MKELHPEKGLRIFDIKWEVRTAGPSPNDNKRIEVFLLGCEKAKNGNPCKGCFNSVTWDKSIAEFARDPIEVADMINEGCDPLNKYISIGGGEPTDQLDYLIPFVKRLKEHGFHILMYTWKSLKEIINHPYISYELTQSNPLIKNTAVYYVLESTYFSSKFREILKYLDIVIDGEFIQEEKLWDINSPNTAQNFIGSGNQILWDIKNNKGYALKDINNVSLLLQYDEIYGMQYIVLYDLKEDAEVLSY